MIKSMTGFGRGEYSDGKRNFTVEVKSVNHRYSDIYVKMPRRYSFAEDMVKNVAKESISRGKTEISIMVENITEDDMEIRLNEPAAEQYIDNLKKLKEKYGLYGEVSLELIAGMPDVIKSIPSIEDEEEISEAIEKALRAALDMHDKMRTVEGQKLAEDLDMRADLVSGYVDKIRERAPQLGREYAENLKARIADLVEGTIDVPEDRILLEAAIFADKASITEELVRLGSHISQLHSILAAGGTTGKKLDFLVQEMNREANTIGAKANDLDITKYMLEIKAEVEKIREQVQNIE
ncbi:MAG: YicC family protein [Eubacteriaceae bacterium]|jgi:uncharacterized protein (TIGR00255 family)|nr:YicC family protein [Eubacteriaceae bacterium]